MKSGGRPGSFSGRCCSVPVQQVGVEQLMMTYARIEARRRVRSRIRKTSARPFFRSVRALASGLGRRCFSLSRVTLLGLGRCGSTPGALAGILRAQAHAPYIRPSARGPPSGAFGRSGTRAHGVGARPRSIVPAAWHGRSIRRSATRTARSSAGSCATIRRAAGYPSVEGAASVAGCPAARQTIYGYERGGFTPSLAQFLELVEFYVLRAPIRGDGAKADEDLRAQGVAAVTQRADAARVSRPGRDGSGRAHAARRAREGPPEEGVTYGRSVRPSRRRVDQDRHVALGQLPVAHQLVDLAGLLVAVDAAERGLRPSPRSRGR